MAGRVGLSRRAAGAVLAVLAAVVLAGCGAGQRASTRTFVGHWWGHTRRLDIAGDGRGREYVHVAGFARPLVVRFRIVRAYGRSDDAVARVRVASVVGSKGILELVRHPNLRADDTGSLLLRHGVITDGLTRDVFCAPNVDKCGL